MRANFYWPQTVANMISIQRARELIGDPNMSDEEVEKARDACAQLARLALEAALKMHRKQKEEEAREPIQATLF